MKNRAILLIGAGGWGATHLTAYTSNKAWRLAGVADLNPQVLRRVQSDYALPASCCFDDPFDAIKKGDYDAISVVVRNPSRVPVLLRALETGAPVFVEKPLVHTLADLRKVYRAIRKSSAPLMVSQNYRFEPQTRRMGELIRKRPVWGRLNTVLVDFTRNIRDFGDHPITRLPEGLGLNAEMCIHHYDLMRFILDADPVRIRAIARRAPKSAMRGWGSLDAWIEFHDSVFVGYHASYDAAVSRTPWGGTWTLDFEKGSMTWYPYANNQRSIDYHSPWRGRWSVQPTLRDPARYYQTHMVATAFEEFTRSLDERRSPECDLRDNAHSLAVMWGVERAVRSGRSLEFRPLVQEVLEKCP